MFSNSLLVFHRHRQWPCAVTDFLLRFLSFHWCQVLRVILWVVFVFNLSASFVQEKKALRKKREAEGIPKQVPHTIESLRIPDETTINITDEKKLETEKDNELDEFSSYFNREVEPKVLITYCDNPMKVFYIFQYFYFWNFDPFLCLRRLLKQVLFFYYLENPHIWKRADKSHTKLYITIPQPIWY